MYSRDLRYLPTSDMEESFEVMSCIAQGTLDAAKKMVILDALSTFVDEAKPQGRDYQSFADQNELDMHCSDAKNGCDVFGSNPKVCISVFSFFPTSSLRAFQKRQPDLRDKGGRTSKCACASLQ